ncbi:MAG: hypothetical protein A3J74_03300 [Elusimicrobia bacterium RIFCSPHIGHO2_02_FULL_57_9]|nr:MAG: hypothetical protein A3J74_03300 [Elusimicrobia bacterium RIFCSPHIGHO2_02_FULL_57_9]
MDKIWLHGIECRVRVGVAAQERKRPQKILIDVGMEMDLAPCARWDDVRLSVDYKAVEGAVRRAAESGERKLAETLAEQIASLVLGLDQRIFAAEVAVHKKPALMPKTREIVVSVCRKRGR